FFLQTRNGFNGTVGAQSDFQNGQTSFDQGTPHGNGVFDTLDGNHRNHFRLEADAVEFSGASRGQLLFDGHENHSRIRSDPSESCPYPSNLSDTPRAQASPKGPSRSLVDS